MESKVLFGSKTLEFTVEYSDRKSLGITVNPDSTIQIKAPVDTSIKQIQEKVLKRAPWILRQQNFFLAFHPRIPERKYVSGETHLYLGRQYRLLINEMTLDSTKMDSVRLSGGFIEVLAKDKSEIKVSEILSSWYREKAKLKFEELGRPLVEDFVTRHKLPIANCRFSILEMPTRWGSCTPKGKILLNPELVKAPRGCIEYVIIHELCHLIHHNHNQQFLALQSKEMPDWERWKVKLENLLA